VNLAQNIYFSFASVTKVRVLSYVVAQYDRDDKILQMKTLHCI